MEHAERIVLHILHEDQTVAASLTYLYMESDLSVTELRAALASLLREGLVRSEVGSEDGPEFYITPRGSALIKHRTQWGARPALLGRLFHRLDISLS